MGRDNRHLTFARGALLAIVVVVIVAILRTPPEQVPDVVRGLADLVRAMWRE